MALGRLGPPRRHRRRRHRVRAHARARSTASSSTGSCTRIRSGSARSRRGARATPSSRIGTLMVIGASLATVVAVWQRFRRARGEERQQMRWLVAVATVAGAGIGGILLLFPLAGVLGLEEGGIGDVIFSILFVPAAARDLRGDSGRLPGCDLQARSVGPRRRDQEGPRCARPHAVDRRRRARCDRRARTFGAPGRRSDGRGRRHRRRPRDLAARVLRSPDRPTRRLRETGGAVPGVERVLRARGRDVRDRGRAATDGADPRRGDRGLRRPGLAPGRRRAPHRGRVARGAPGPRCRLAPRRRAAGRRGETIVEVRDRESCSGRYRSRCRRATR